MARHYLMRPFVGQIPRAAAATSWARPPPALVAGAWAWNRKTKGRTLARRPLHRWQPGLPTYIRLLQFDFDINASWQVQLHQCVNGLVGWVDDVHQALVGADFELVARGLVDVRRTQNVETLDAGWQWNWAFDHGAGALGGVNDFQGRLVDQLVVESLQADTDFFW
jgi:hypothetical protein